MKSKEPSGWKDYFKSYKKELLLGGVATLSVMYALGVGHSSVSDKGIQPCTDSESINPTVKDPDELLGSFILSTGEFVKISGLRSASGLVHRPNIIGINKLFNYKGAGTALVNLDEPKLDTKSEVFCRSVDDDTYRVNNKALDGARLLVDTGAADLAIQDLVNQG